MKYSIIVPIYNVENYINECIDSILNQSLNDYELILVDDGSTDKSSQICDEYANERLVKVVHKKNGGLSDARNCGVDNATGDYIWFIDGDDFVVNDHVLKTIDDAIEENDILSFNYARYVDTENKYLRKKINIKESESLRDMIKVNAFNTSSCNKIFKRKLIIDNNIRFPFRRPSEDTYFCAKSILAGNKFKYINLDGYAYRYRNNSITKNINSEKYLDIMKLIGEILSEADRNSDNYETMCAYVAYQYTCTLPFVNRLHDSRLTAEAKSLSFLLSYDLCQKVRLVNISTRLIGFDNTISLLDFYLKKTKKQ